MSREVIDTWIERAILALVAGVIMSGAAAFGGVRPSEFLFMWWLVVAAAGLWIARIWLAPKFRFLFPPLCWSILPFVAYAIWRYSTADVEFPARQELIQILLGALLLLIIVNNLYSQESVRTLSYVLAFFAMLVAMYGLYQYLSGSNLVWGQPRDESYRNRASGPYICPNHYAGFLEMLLPLALSLTVTGRMNAVLRVGLGYATLVILAGIAASQSRAGWVACAISVVFCGLCLLRTRGYRKLAAVVLVIVSIGGYWLYTKTLQERVAALQVTGHGKDIRFRLWTAGIKIWKESPWFGAGPDHYDFRYRQHRDAVDRAQARPGRAHNDYVNTLADYGACGLVLALLPLGVAAWTARRCWPYVQRSNNDFGQKKSSRLAVVVGVCGGLVAIAVHSFFDFNMHIPANAFLAVALLGLLACHMRFATERFWFTARWHVATVATLLLAGALFYLGSQAAERTQEVRLLQRAQAAPHGSQERIEHLLRAFTEEPKNFETAFAIAEQLRSIAWMGEADTNARATEALQWYEQALALNRWDVASMIGAGMCLHWIERHHEAAPYFEKALRLDPNHWYPRAMMGWHLFQLDRYEEAIGWFHKALEIGGIPNQMCHQYLHEAEKRLKEQRSGMRRF
jgi:O-antigen ligase